MSKLVPTSTLLCAKIDQRHKGLTMMELILVVSILFIITSALLKVFDPRDYYKRARDNKRLSDVMLLERIIAEYQADNTIYPDTQNALRRSTQLPTNNLGPLSDPSFGWIRADLTQYNSRLPLDPKNNSSFYYSYIHSGTHYEINTVLEYYLDKAANDGGNNNAIYETGTSLTLIN